MDEKKTTLLFNPEKVKALKRAYTQAVEAKQENFTFEGHTIFAGYAKYMIEYLEQELSTKKEVKIG